MSLLNMPRGDTLTHRTDAVERYIIRAALNKYREDLEKSAKGRGKLSLPSEDEKFAIAAIDGTEGFGRGIYSMFQEPGDPPLKKDRDQIDIEDELGLSEEERQARIDFQNVRDELAREIAQELELPDAALPAFILAVRAGAPEDADDCEAWLEAHEAREDGDEPPRKPWALVQAEEDALASLLSPEEIAHYSGAAKGPWAVESEPDDEVPSVKHYFGARLSGGEGSSTDRVRSTNEDEVRRRVAFLNKQAEEEAATEAESEAAEAVST